MQLLINAFPVQTPYFETIGFAMHQFIGKINHNCQPNAIITFSGADQFSAYPLIKVVPLRAISKDEEITVSYVDTATPRTLRRRLLRESYFFSCKCGRCASAGDGNDPTAKLNIQELLHIGVDLLEHRSLADETKPVASRIQYLRYAIHHLLSKDWPVAVEPFPHILHKLVMAYLEDLQINMALVFSAILHYRANTAIYEGLRHPVGLNQGFLLYRIMDSVLSAQEWERQTLDLASKEIELVYLHDRLIRELSMTAVSPSANELKYRIIDCQIICGKNYKETELNDDILLEKAMINMDKLMDDMLEDIKVWR